MVNDSLDAINVIFDDDRPVADAGVLLVATLARKLGIEGLVLTCLAASSCPRQPPRPPSQAEGSQPPQSPRARALASTAGGGRPAQATAGLYARLRPVCALRPTSLLYRSTPGSRPAPPRRRGAG
jgi:hypothetical protein